MPSVTQPNNRYPYLSKLGLTIRTQIFIPEAARKLIIPWQPTSHENLLILLRALGQSISQSLPPCRHNELPCAFRRRLEQQRSLDLHKRWTTLLQLFLTKIVCAGAETQCFAQLCIRSQLKISLLRWEDRFRCHDQVLREVIERVNFFQCKLPLIFDWCVLTL